MNIIEQLGGYEKAKEALHQIKSEKKDLISCGASVFVESQVIDAILDYRRQHNIFEVGDKVVSINSAFIEYQGVLNIDFINKFDLMLSDGCKGLEVNAICGWSKIIRHATDEEIEAGKRLG